MFSDISIHAARVGCDLLFLGHECHFPLFQSTQPEWAATETAGNGMGGFYISIHAARVGCDRNIKNIGNLRRISIHAARVGCDDLNSLKKCGLNIFQSTQPEWAATCFV